MTSDVIGQRVSRAGECIDGRYQLETEIGAGGLGSVYRATQTKLARQVAVKLLHEHMGASDVQRARFEREARALAALEHPNIVSILDYGVADDQPYIVTELLEGETLAQRLRAGSLEIEHGLLLADQLLDALAFMHEAGVVHRDLKASNVFLQRVHDGERVKLLDFGLAKTTVSPGTSGDSTLTRDGTVVGTPAYMSPEQATGDVVDARSDVYAVGVLLYQMLTGRLPFEGDAIDQVRSHLVEPVPALELERSASGLDHGQSQRVRRLDAAIEQLIRRAMAKRREERYANARAMLTALTEIRERGEAQQTLPPTAAVTQPLTINAQHMLSPLAAALRWARMLCVVVVCAQLPLLVWLARDAEGRAALHKLGERSRVALSELGEHSTGALRRRGQPEGSPAPRSASPSTPTRSGSLPSAADPGSQPPAANADARAIGSPTANLASGSPVQGLPLSAADADAHVLAPGSPLSAANADARLLGPASPTTPVSPGSGSPLSAANADARLLGPASPPTAAGAAQTGATWPAAATTDATLRKADGELADPTRAVTPGAQEATAPPPSAAPPRAADLAVPGPPRARNPWSRPTPPELRGIRRSILAGGAGDDRVVLALKGYSQSHPGDPRAQLLLGQMYLNRNWRSEAVAQYGSALKTDLSARGAPELLPALIELVASGKSEPEASALIVRAYGSEALPALSTKLANTHTPDATARLKSLRARLDRVKATN